MFGLFQWRTQKFSDEEGYFEYGNFEFENGLFRKTKWGTKNKVGN